MIFHGFQKTTLLDYPGHVASIVFTAGCNFRCPYCHNGNLVLPEKKETIYTETEILSFLETRKKTVDGLCVSGGEPTIHPDLPQFLSKVKKLGLSVKLDTNGTNPVMLSALLTEHLVDYVALDIKAPFDSYPQVTGFSSIPGDTIKHSLSILLASSCPHEIRTTIVKELHTADMIRAITREIEGCQNYFLQNFKDSGDILIYRQMDSQDTSLLTPFSEEEANVLLQVAKERIPYAKLR